MCKASERAPQRRHRAVYIAPSMAPQHRGAPILPLLPPHPREQQQRQQQQHLPPSPPLPQHFNFGGGGFSSFPRSASDNDFEASRSGIASDHDDQQVIPLLIDVPSQRPGGEIIMSPPSSGNCNSESEHYHYDYLQPPSSPIDPSSKTQLPLWKKSLNLLITAYYGLIDLWLLVVVCFMGCFFYDVEVRVVKSEMNNNSTTSGRRRKDGGGRRRTGRRVVLEGAETPPSPHIVSSPPQSGNLLQQLHSSWNTTTNLGLGGESQHSRRSQQPAYREYAWDV